jgi:hypothetical protein
MKVKYSKSACNALFPTFFCLLVLLPALALFSAPKLTITVGPQQTKTWETNVGPADIVGGAGSDFPAEYESTVDYFVIEVKNSANNWEVSVQKTDAGWPVSITVSARRSSDGTSGDPGATISGGSGYQAVTSTDALLFGGFGDWADVGIQLKVSGSYASFGIDAGTYTTTVTYTVIDGL